MFTASEIQRIFNLLAIAYGGDGHQDTSIPEVSILQAKLDVLADFEQRKGNHERNQEQRREEPATGAAT